MKRLKPFIVNNKVIVKERKQKLFNDNIKATEYMTLDAKNLILGGLEDIRIYSYVAVRSLLQALFSILLFVLSPIIIPIRCCIIWFTRHNQKDKKNAK